LLRRADGTTYNEAEDIFFEPTMEAVKRLTPLGV